MTYEAQALEVAAEDLLRVSAAVDGGLLSRLDAWSRTRGSSEDPTGDAALDRDRIREDRARFQTLSQQVTQAAGELLRIAEANDPGEHCASCLNAGYRVPVTRRGSGEPYHKGLCRRCGERQSITGQRPDVEWVQRMNRRRQTAA